jgi:serine/threonine protein kinase
MSETLERWSRDALPKGTVVQGFTVEAILGRGGFGITYRVRDKLDQVFALKECFPRQFAVRHGLEVYPADQADEAGLRDCLERFLREAKALSSIARLGPEADGVVRVATFCEAYRTAYIVMEYLAGESLQNLLGRTPGGLLQTRVNDLLVRLLLALRSVHDVGMLHRDIKPSNIFLRNDGRPVLIDFGATRIIGMEQTLAFTQIISEKYSPIEQFSGERQGPFSDLYALGMCCYRAIGGKAVDCLSRQQALDQGAPDPLPPAVRIGGGQYEPALLRTIDALLQIRPADRPQSAREALAMLTEAEGDTSGVVRQAAKSIGLNTETARKPLSPVTRDAPDKARPASSPRTPQRIRFIVLCALSLAVGFGATITFLTVWPGAQFLAGSVP